MRSPLPPQQQGFSALLIILLALVMIASPLLQWWSGSGSPWYIPYLLWGGIIALIAVLNLNLHKRNHVE